MKEEAEPTKSKKPRFTLVASPTYADYSDPNARSITTIPISQGKRAAIVADIDRLFKPDQEMQTRVLFTGNKISFISNPPLTDEDVFYITDIIRHVTG